MDSAVILLTRCSAAQQALAANSPLASFFGKLRGRAAEAQRWALCDFVKRGELHLLLEMLSTLSAGLFTGAAIYINLVEHPARIECGTSLAITEFAPSYRRAAVLQGALGALGFLIATAAWLMGSSFWWLIGGLVLLAVIPFTLVVIFPTNKQLLDSSLDKNSELASQLLTRWGRLHAVRSVLGLISFLIFIFLLGRSARA